MSWEIDKQSHQSHRSNESSRAESVTCLGSHSQGLIGPILKLGTIWTKDQAPQEGMPVCGMPDHGKGGGHSPDLMGTVACALSATCSSRAAINKPSGYLLTYCFGLLTPNAKVSILIAGTCVGKTVFIDSINFRILDGEITLSV